MGIYLKSSLAGLVTALLACVIAMGLTIAIAFATMRYEVAATGSGGLGAVSFGFSEAGLEFAFPVGFAVGFFWMLRRLRRRAGQAGAV